MCVGMSFRREESSAPPPAASQETLDAVGSSDFKYGCLGYGVYKAAVQRLREEHGQTSAASATTAMGMGRRTAGGAASVPDLPWCEGLEVIASSGEPADAAKGVPNLSKTQGKAPAKSADDSVLTGLAQPMEELLQDFPEKFKRSSMRILNQMQSNAYKLATAVGYGVDWVWSLGQRDK